MLCVCRLENYSEMRASTGDEAFRMRKAVENALENSCLGGRFRSRYAMVSCAIRFEPAVQCLQLTAFLLP